MNAGHENMQCEYCHLSDNGSLRQQLQANIQYLLGNRSAPVETGFADVGNKACASCHSRPRDNHPVYRFNEPKFKKARETLQPHQCISCHREHTGKRVTRDPEFCKHCHEKLTIRNDKTSTPHSVLVREKRWTTCLGCHDFHGNYQMKLRIDLSMALASNRIKQYFEGGPPPWSNNKKFRARKIP
jgi:ribosomal protein L37AE/L43A